MSIEDFLRKQLTEALKEFNVEETFDVKFVLFPEIDPKRQSLSTLEEMFNWWALPNRIYREITFSETVMAIYYIHGIAPMWIKISWIEKGKLIGLELSQKLRKRKQIEDYHQDKNNLYPPFIFSNPYIEFHGEIKRLALLKNLTLRLWSEDYLIEYFKMNLPKVSEIKHCILQNFESGYRFYPNNYTHRNETDQGYTDLVIRKDKSQEQDGFQNVISDEKSDQHIYQIFSQKGGVIKSSYDLDELLDYFLSHQLNYRIGDLEILE